MKAWNKQEEAGLLSERRVIATPNKARSSPLTANLGELAIADLLQTLVRTGKDAVVTIRHAGQLSHVCCEAGRIVDAESPPFSGAEALRQILSIRQGQVTAVFQRADRPVTIHQSLESLILEHVRRLDEAGDGQTLTAAANISSPVVSADERVQTDRPPPGTASEPWRDEARSSAPRSGFRTRVTHVSSEHWQDALIAEAAPFAEDEPTAKQRQMITVIQEPVQRPSSVLIALKRRRGLSLVVLASALGVGIVTWQALQLRPTPASLETPAPAPPLRAASPQAAGSIELDVWVEPERAELSLDGTKIAVGHALARLEDDGREHQLEVRADGYLSETLRFTHVAPRGRIALVRKPAPIVVEQSTPDDAASSMARSRRPKTVHTKSLGDAVKPSVAREIEVASPLAGPRIRVIEGADPKIKILE